MIFITAFFFWDRSTFLFRKKEKGCLKAGAFDLSAISAFNQFFDYLWLVNNINCGKLVFKGCFLEEKSLFLRIGFNWDWILFF